MPKLINAGFAPASNMLALPLCLWWDDSEDECNRLVIQILCASFWLEFEKGEGK